MTGALHVAEPLADPLSVSQGEARRGTAMLLALTCAVEALAKVAVDTLLQETEATAETVTIATVTASVAERGHGEEGGGEGDKKEDLEKGEGKT